MQSCLKDTHDFGLQLAAMDIDINETQYKTYVKRRHETERSLADIGLLPNNNQFGCAVGAVIDRKRPRNVISVPSGKGKSRIIAAVIALRAQYYKQPHFTIVYSTELLK